MMPDKARVGIEFYQEGLQVLLDSLDQYIAKLGAVGAGGGGRTGSNAPDPNPSYPAPNFGGAGGNPAIGQPSVGGISGGNIVVYGGTWAVQGGNWTVHVNTMTVQAQTVNVAGGAGGGGPSATGGLSGTPQTQNQAGQQSGSQFGRYGTGLGQMFGQANNAGLSWMNNMAASIGGKAAIPLAVGVTAMNLAALELGESPRNEDRIRALPGVGFLADKLGFTPFLNRDKQMGQITDLMASQGRGFDYYADRTGVPSYHQPVLDAYQAMIQAGLSEGRGRPFRVLNDLPGGLQGNAARAYSSTFLSTYQQAFGGGEAPTVRGAFFQKLASGDTAGALALAPGLPGGAAEAQSYIDISNKGTRFAIMGSMLGAQAGTMGGIAGGALSIGSGAEAAGYMDIQADVLRLQSGQLDGEIAAKVSELENTKDPAAAMIIRQQLVQLQGQKSGISVQLRGMPSARAQGIYQQQAAGPQSQVSMGQATLGLLSASGATSGFDAAYGQVGAGIGGGIEALQTQRASLTGRVDPSVIAGIDAQIAQMQAQQSALPFQQARTIAGAGMAVSSSTVSGGQSRLGTQNIKSFFNQETSDIYDTISGGIQSAIRTQKELLATLMSEGAGKAATGPVRAAIDALNQQLTQNILDKVSHQYRDISAQAGYRGAISQSGLSIAGAYGSTDVGAIKAGQHAYIQSIDDKINAARAEKAQTPSGPRRAELDAEIAQLQAQKASVIAGASEQQYAGVVAAGSAFMQGGGAERAAGLTYGLGSHGTAAAGNTQLAGANAILSARQAMLAAARASGKPSTLILQYEAQVAEAAANVKSIGGSIAGYQPSAAVEETLGAARYEAQVLSVLPFAYGDMREAKRAYIGAIGGKKNDLQAWYHNNVEGNPDKDTPAVRHAFNEQMRSLSMEQAQGYQELSYGWESRLTNQLINSPGNFAFLAHDFTFRDAVGGGLIDNPHFGARLSNQRKFMDLRHQLPSVNIAGATGTPEGFFATAMGRAGVPADGTGPFGSGLGVNGLRGNESTLNVVLKIQGPGGGEMKQSVTVGGATQAGAGGGNLGEIIFNLGPFTPSQHAS